MSETSVMNAMDDALPSIGYLNVHGICRRTYGKETKAHTDNPHFPTHNVNWGYPTQERLKRLRIKSGKSSYILNLSFCVVYVSQIWKDNSAICCL